MTRSRMQFIIGVTSQKILMRFWFLHVDDIPKLIANFSSSLGILSYVVQFWSVILLLTSLWKDLAIFKINTCGSIAKSLPSVLPVSGWALHLSVALFGGLVFQGGVPSASGIATCFLSLSQWITDLFCLTECYDLLAVTADPRGQDILIVILASLCVLVITSCLCQLNRITLPLPFWNPLLKVLCPSSALLLESPGPWQRLLLSAPA